MARADQLTNHERWAEFRYAVVGRLLAEPLEAGQLAEELDELAKITWRNPVTGAPFKRGRSTIERWYYEALKAANPVEALRRKSRSDAGSHPSVSNEAAEQIKAQYDAHKAWTCSLHYANLQALKRLNGGFELPSYNTYVRYRHTHSMRRMRLPTMRHTAGAEYAAYRKEHREVRSYEAACPNALWHSDSHESSLRVLMPDGRWVFPHLAASWTITADGAVMRSGIWPKRRKTQPIPSCKHS